MKASLSCLLLLAFHPAAFAQDTDYQYNRYKAWGYQAENEIRAGAVDISRADANTEKLFFALTEKQPFPDQVYEMKNLKVLWVNNAYDSCCPVVGKISDKLNSLTKLEHIHLGGVGVTGLPANLGNLTSLKSLSVTEAEASTASLAVLPELKALPSLTALYFESNKKTELAKAKNFSSIFAVMTLKVLVLNSDMLAGEQLGAIGNLKELEVLELSGNRLGAFPALGGNQKLQQIIARDSGLVKLGDDVTTLPQLTFLDLAYNKLTSLPADIGKLNKLRFLELSHNDLTSFPSSMEQLAQLEYLSLRGNEITEIPAFVYGLKNLKELDLLETKIAKLDPRLGDMNIQTLAISHQQPNGFSFDPEMLARMKGLKKVQMSNLLVEKDVIQAKGRLKKLRPDMWVH